MRIPGLIVVVAVTACASKPSQKDSVGSGASPPPAVLADAAPAAKRSQPPPLAKDDRPIDAVSFRTLLNARDATHGTIFASADGGCHVYVRDPKAPIGPPGSFPPPTPIACPAGMLQPEWHHCVGPGTVHADAKAECICQPGAGDPPGPPFRMPCPK